MACPARSTYQWKRVDSDGSVEPDQHRHRLSHLHADHQRSGNTRILVEVSFTDSLGEAESLASGADPSTGTVRAADNTAPTVTSIERQEPTALVTNSDTPTWRVTFSVARQRMWTPLISLSPV